MHTSPQRPCAQLLAAACVIIASATVGNGALRRDHSGTSAVVVHGELPALPDAAWTASLHQRVAAALQTPSLGSRSNATVYELEGSGPAKAAPSVPGGALRRQHDTHAPTLAHELSSRHRRHKQALHSRNGDVSSTHNSTASEHPAAATRRHHRAHSKPQAGRMHIPANSELLTWSGRTTSTAKVPVAFDFAGVSVRFVVTGTERLSVVLAARSPCKFIVVVDHAGAERRAVRLSAHIPEGELPLLTNLTRTKVYTIEFFRSSEPVYGITYLFSFVVDSSSVVTRASPRRYRMEVISESTALGYGVLGKGIGASGMGHGCTAPYSSESAYFGSCFQFCRAVDAACHVIAASGLVLEENSQFHDTAPDLWRRTLSDGIRRWDFSRFTPDVAYIHIGQNDVQNRVPSLKQPWSQLLSAFVDEVRDTYSMANPRLAVVLGCGIMSHDYCDSVRSAVAMQRAAHPHLVTEALELFSSLSGCRHHPNVNESAHIAAQLQKVIGPILERAGS